MGFLFTSTIIFIYLILFLELKGNSTTNEELHNLIVQRIHSKIDFLKDAVSKFEVIMFIV